MRKISVNSIAQFQDDRYSVALWGDNQILDQGINVTHSEVIQFIGHHFTIGTQLDKERVAKPSDRLCFGSAMLALASRLLVLGTYALEHDRLSIEENLKGETGAFPFEQEEV